MSEKQFIFGYDGDGIQHRVGVASVGDSQYGLLLAAEGDLIVRPTQLIAGANAGWTVSTGKGCLMTCDLGDLDADLKVVFEPEVPGTYKLVLKLATTTEAPISSTLNFDLVMAKYGIGDSHIAAFGTPDSETITIDAAAKIVEFTATSTIEVEEGDIVEALIAKTADDETSSASVELVGIKLVRID